MIYGTDIMCYGQTHPDKTVPKQQLFLQFSLKQNQMDGGGKRGRSKEQTCDTC